MIQESLCGIFAYFESVIWWTLEIFWNSAKSSSGCLD